MTGEARASAAADGRATGVGPGMPPPGASGGGGAPSIRPVSNTGADSWHWEYDHNGLMVRVDDVEPIDPGGAAGGGFGGLAPVGP